MSLSASILGTAGIAAHYSLQLNNKNKNLIPEGEECLDVNEALVGGLHGEAYQFTHKAIWACKLLLPIGGHVARDIFSTAVTELPPTEHWAFVARGVCNAFSPPKVAYFIAQFSDGEIKPLEELGTEGTSASHNFSALLQEKSKKSAALSIVSNPSASDVWIHTPVLTPRRLYIYRSKRLVSPGFKEDEWAPMRPMKLKELNDHIYRTKCTGKKYDLLYNNCQHFAEDLFNIV